MEKVRRRILSILLTLLILFSNSVVTFAYSQEVPELLLNGEFPLFLPVHKGGFWKVNGGKNLG